MRFFTMGLVAQQFGFNAPVEAVHTDEHLRLTFISRVGRFHLPVMKDIAMRFHDLIPVRRRQTSLVSLALIIGALAFSPSAQADDVLPDGTTPATELSLIPAVAKTRKDTVVGAISSPQGIFNPYFFTNGWDENVTDVIFGRLINYDSHGKLIAEQADSWTVSPDGLVYTLKLRPDLVFSDGSPLTAEDVAFTLTVLHDPTYEGETDITPAAIAGGAEYKAGKADSISGLKVIDPQTLQVTATQPGAKTPYLIGGPVLSKAHYGNGFARGKLDGIRALGNNPLGAGSYVFDKYIPGQEVRFHANPHYFRGKPGVENFIYRITSDATKLQLFQTGETDYDGFSVNQDNIDTLKSLGFAAINLYGSSDYSMIEFNQKKPALQDAKVRHALTYGLDRQTLVSVVYQGYGQVATIPVAPISWAYDPSGIEPYAYDPAKAAALLDEAGWKAGPDGIRTKDGQRLSLTLLATKSLINDALIPIAKENFKAIGVDLVPEVSDFNAMLAKMKSGNFDLATYRTSGINDPHDGVEDFISATGEIGRRGYHNADVDRLVDAGNATTDIDKRKAIYHELYKVLAEDPPVIYLAYRKILSAADGRVSGFNPDIYNGIISSLPNLKIAQ
ncbi:peptide/nickel transport system substrate-binding protein [Phyllobacterium sp. OV277]|nr:peptide/nickel transport system substrate-binding protein [Phyllobacterium sp. OV277]